MARLVGTAPGAVSAFRQLPARARVFARAGLRVAHGPDGGGRVTAAPPRFAAVLEQPELCTELGRLSSAEWGWGTLREIQLRALKWHRERCTFELVMETTQGRYITIAKVFDEQRSHILPTMEAIRRAGFGSEAAVAISRPLADFRARRALVGANARV